MWIFTKSGFYSVVADQEQAGKVVVRSRWKEDLANLNKGLKVKGKIIQAQKADYPFRMIIDQLAWARFLHGQAEMIDYLNFKDQIKDYERHDLYLKVWAALKGLNWKADYLNMD